MVIYPQVHKKKHNQAVMLLLSRKNPKWLQIYLHANLYIKSPFLQKESYPFSIKFIIAYCSQSTPD